jgi:hypothetical protein
LVADEESLHARFWEVRHSYHCSQRGVKRK